MMNAVSAAAQNPAQNFSAIQAVAGGAGVKLTIVDPTGAVIPRASIVIFEVMGSLEVSGQSDDGGSYQTLDLKPGSWKIIVSSPGFEPRKITANLNDREIFQSVIKLNVITTTMGVIVEVDDMAAPVDAIPMPNTLVSSQLPAEAAAPPPKLSRNPSSRLLRKLHF